MIAMRRFTEVPGVIVKDLLRYQLALSKSGRGFQSHERGWISLRNRIERLVTEEDLPGVRCDWRWGSALHATEVMPWLARAVMKRSLEEWPIVFSNEPRVIATEAKISFIFAHAGRERLPQLKRTIRSIFAQVEVPCEVVVVDQTPVPLLASMPAPITYRHLELPAGTREFHKTLAYNLGARVARGSILVFHDGDICVPAQYAQELIKTFDHRGFGAASLQRFLYYLDAEDTRKVEASDAIRASLNPHQIFQNWKGGTVAIRRDAFASIGGFDEAFTGWGGEDLEFCDRCLEVRHCGNGYLPFVHLWHAPQPSKSGPQRDQNLAFFDKRMEEPRLSRIQRLRANVP